MVIFDISQVLLLWVRLWVKHFTGKITFNLQKVKKYQLGTTVITLSQRRKLRHSEV